MKKRVEKRQRPNKKEIILSLLIAPISGSTTIGQFFNVKLTNEKKFLKGLLNLYSLQRLELDEQIGKYLITPREMEKILLCAVKNQNQLIKKINECCLYS